MKRLISISLFVLSVCIVLPLNASELVVRVFDGSDFYVNMNGRQYQTYSGSLTISGLDNGNHFLEIYKKNVLRDPAYIKVFSGSVNVPPYMRVITELDRNNSLRIVRKENLNGSSNGHSYGNGNGHGNSYGNSYSSNYSDPYGSSYGYNNSYGNSGYNSYYGSSGSYGSYSGYNYGMAPATFDALMMTLDHESFDSRRLSIASSAIASNGVTTYQLADIMAMFSFDSNRLTLAKRSYPYIADKNNVFVLNDAFTFSSNADSFFRYIGVW